MVNFLQRSYPKWNGSSRTETVLDIAIIVSALLLRSSKGCERTGMWIEFKGRSILAPGDANSCNPAAASLLAQQRCVRSSEADIGGHPRTVFIVNVSTNTRRQPGS